MNKTTAKLKLSARAIMMLALCAGALSCAKDKSKNPDNNKTTPTVTVTGSYQLYKGEELATLTLAGTAADGDKAVEGTLAWKDGATTFKESGEQEAGWVFTPKDSGTYQNAEGTVKVTVKPNIYVAGETGGVGKVWKNGEVLYSFDDTEWSEATSITVYEGDIYVATESDKAKIWKNGKVLYELPSDTDKSYPAEIVVSGGDVYTAGCFISRNNSAVVWKNDEVLYKWSVDNESSHVKSVSISGDDVYAAGFGPWETGKLWKNGNVLHQSEGNYSNVIVSGNDVYYSGYKGRYPNRIATVWKNGKELYSFGDGETDTSAGSIILSGSDIYVPVGNKIYRNDKVLYTLKGENVYSISIEGSDLYAVNLKFPSDEKNLGQVWKNGELLYTIGDGNKGIYTYSIFVD